VDSYWFDLLKFSIIMPCFTVHQRAEINTMISTNRHHHLQERRGPGKMVVVVTDTARRGEFIVIEWMYVIKMQGS
jgi:hypothetical protein